MKTRTSIVLVAAAIALGGCVQDPDLDITPPERLSSQERIDRAAEQGTEVIASDEAVDDFVRLDEGTDFDFTGPKPIGELITAMREERGRGFVWHGYASEDQFPVQGDCEADRPGDQLPDVFDELPATIEGVVTLHPRFYQKHAICGQDERFYGSFFIQDASGGIMVLRDSRVAQFTLGDRVRMDVIGAYANGFGEGFDAIIAFENLENLGPYKPDDAGRGMIHSDDIGARDFAVSDIGQVRTIEGFIVSEATNNNFNEMLVSPVQNPGDGDVVWLVGIDRELGQRGLPYRNGDRIRAWGPVVDSFGMRMVVASYAQLSYADGSQ